MQPWGQGTPRTRSPFFPGGGGERLRGGGCEAENVKKEVVPSLKKKNGGGVELLSEGFSGWLMGEQQCLGDRICGLFWK